MAHGTAVTADTADTAGARVWRSHPRSPRGTCVERWPRPTLFTVRGDRGGGGKKLGPMRIPLSKYFTIQTYNLITHKFPYINGVFHMYIYICLKIMLNWVMHSIKFYKWGHIWLYIQRTYNWCFGS